jgi:hypothetical protein
MQPAERIITVTPVRELWDDHGTVNARRSRDVASDEIRELLRRGPLQFVVVEIGFKPRWLPEADCFTLWKAEVQPHLPARGMPARLEEFPNGYCYFASEWSRTNGSPIVVLEKAH